MNDGMRRVASHMMPLALEVFVTYFKNKRKFI
jgi:hypothetical protein